jgi:hypothetical protein
MRTKFSACLVTLAALLAGCATAPSPYLARTDAAFAAVPIGKANKETIRATFGPPDETMYLRLRDLQVWSYRYRQSDVWYSMMHIHFDRDGIVREMLSGPDPEREERRFGW